MAALITFTNITGDDSIPAPQPASQFIPDWYKKTEAYIGGKKTPPIDDGSVTLGTIKKCMPVFDSITSGYIITSPVEIHVQRIGDNLPFFSWPNHNAIQFHPIEQAPLHPNKNGFPYPKWTNPWAIKTPKGYSVLIVSPMHHDLPWSILPGVVDTDTYTLSINFPFVMKDVNFEGFIPQGTPIAQVIPFKRETWKSKLGGKKEADEMAYQQNRIKNIFYDRYKTIFRSKKSYQ